MNMLEKINIHLELLSKSERKVAEVILLSPQTAIHFQHRHPRAHGGRQRTNRQPFLPPFRKQRLS